MSFSGFEGKSQGRDFYSWLYWIIQRTSQRAQGDTKKKRLALVLREFTVLLWSLWTVLFLRCELMTQWLPLGNTSFTPPMPMEEPQVKLQKIQGPNVVLAVCLFTGLSTALPHYLILRTLCSHPCLLSGLHRGTWGSEERVIYTHRPRKG